ncbi:unnamed protein product [Adineta ricciae]|uniref:Uncharacterized protein n=1 Tax=Adineta ricciae TaxID=249248 RepID=A0A814QGI0_ADIRI|nr:unnamed protein product [Adineta ricciae]CAF1119026.1 unnamed protein product [Adineta ricciae]
MDQTSSSMSTDTRQLDGDGRKTPSPYSNEVGLSIESTDSSSNPWSLPVQSDRWTNLPQCMGFVAKYRMQKKPVELWMRQTLNRLSWFSKAEQLRHLMNGYADLYKIVIHVITVKDDMPIFRSDIVSYSGTASREKREHRRRDLAYIMHQPDRSLFAPFYAVSATDDLRKTTFTTDDMDSLNHVAYLLNEINNKISQRRTMHVEDASENHDATVDGQELEGSDSLNVFLSSPSANERNIATLKPPNEFVPHCNLLTVMLPDHLQPVSESVPMETDECRSAAENDSGEKKSIPQGILMPRKQRRRRRENTQKNMIAPVALSENTEGTAPLIEPQPETIADLPHECDSFKIKVHPTRYRRVRMLTDLAELDCPLVQASDQKQRVYPEIELKDLSDRADHIRIRAVTETGHAHPWQCVAPMKHQVYLQMESTHGERRCLQCDPDKFNSEDESVYSAINSKERKTRKKLIQVHLFKWKHARANIAGGAEKENPLRCRLEVYLCKRLDPGKFELLSQPCYTTIIEQGDGDLSIDPNQIEPKALRATGGERISFPLSVRCPKKNFCIELNGRNVDSKAFEVKKKELLITSPPKPNQDDRLRVTIKQVQNVGASSHPKADILYDGYLEYVS